MGVSKHYRKDIDQNEAANYERKRFASRRMQKLDRIEKEFAQEILNMIGKDAAVLDIPCGTGRFFDVFAPAKELFMFDYAQNMVDELLKKRPEASNRVVRQGDVMNIPLEDNRVDLAFCMRLFHHFPENELRLKALRELTRVSRKYVAFSFYCKESWRYWRKRMRNRDQNHNCVAMKQMIAEAESCGLKFLKRRPAFEMIEQQRCLLFEKKK